MKKSKSRKTLIPFLLLAWLFLAGCVASKRAFDPQKKYTPAELRNDFSVFRGILENHHPGLYWFTPKEQMDQFFSEGFAALNDSMNETAFLNRLTFIASQIRCGHTTVRRSRAGGRYQDTAAAKLFPLNVKVWPDSMAVTSNLNANDSQLRKGTIITAINGRSVRQWTDDFSQYIAVDGNSLNGKYQALSNTGSFAGLYRRLIGEPDRFSVCFRDSNGTLKETLVPAYVRTHSVKQKNAGAGSSPQKKQRIRIHPLRHLVIDTLRQTAVMTLNTFSSGNGLRTFFRKSFRLLEANGVENLVLDVRANGGGDANLAILLTRYLISRPFRVADSLYAVKNSSAYARYIDHRFLYSTAMRLITKREEAERLHFRYFERHVFPPKKKNRFEGNVYLIIGGNSFSATTVFLKMVQGEKNVTVVGEETGGGRYGNSAWMLPQVTLPKTGIRFTLPLFRMVMDKTAVASGTGILPDVHAGATQESIRKDEDPKMLKTFELIAQRKKKSAKESAY